MENSAIHTSVSAILADPSKWRALLDQFEEVLKINIFIVDRHGCVLVPLNSCRYGAALISSTFGINFQKEGGAAEAVVLQGFGESFAARGAYLQVVDPFDLHLCAVPVKKDADNILFYLVVGPLRLSPHWPEEKYVALASSLGLESVGFLECVRSVPQVSGAALNAILDLLSEVVKDVFELSLEKQKFSQLQVQGGTVRPEIIAGVQDLLVNIQHDELLIAILDAAIKMAGAEGGSIMTLDEESSDFVIKVSRGLENKKNIVQHRCKVGEGIAGTAAREKVPFFISGTEGDVRIRHLLKRPDIRQSFVVPIVAGPDSQVIGILNLSIKNQDSPISIPDVQVDIQKFSPLIAAALRSL
ncbi:MAG: GAF domain-containing protein [Candidatus Omnitrophica bacterium]|nr:GAF domain-containing protein [Candidatus Omnitrophota bacterium]